MNEQEIRANEYDFAFAENKPKEIEIAKPNAFKKVMNIIFSIAGIIGGVMSIIWGYGLQNRPVGSSEANNMYGGDAYTGIQNAAAQTANNVQKLGYIMRDGLGYLLIAIGIIAICYFGIRLFWRNK